MGFSVLGKASDTSFGSAEASEAGSAEADAAGTLQAKEAAPSNDQLKKEIDSLKAKTKENANHISGNDRRNTLMMDDNERRIDAMEKRLDGGIQENKKKVTEASSIVKTTES